VVQSPFAIGYLVGVAIENSALEATATAIVGGKLAHEQVLRLRDQLTAIGITPAVSNHVDKGERFFGLDMICNMAQNRKSAQSIADIVPINEKIPAAELLALARGRIDWDVPLVALNHWYDQLVAIGFGPVADRPKAIDDLDANVAAWRKQFADSPPLSPFAKGSSGELLAAQFALLSISSLTNIYHAEARCETKRRAVLLACELELYRFDHGGYPKSLDELVPKYVAAVPNDAFADRPFVYLRDGKGYKLYSLGSNAVDDGGVDKQDEDKDDVGVINLADEDASRGLRTE
jgi:hypothetical protein